MDLYNTHTGMTTKGKDTFGTFVSRLRDTLRESEYGTLPTLEIYEEKFYPLLNNELGHYFRTLYNVIKFIDNADVENKVFYSNILRARLSDNEVAILFYNGLSKYGREKFKPLIETYALLKNLNENQIFDKSLKQSYSLAAFGNAR